MCLDVMARAFAEGAGLPLVQGKRYHIVFRLESQRVNHEAVMDFMGRDRSWAATLNFSARPVAGTQAMERDCIITVTEVSKNTPIYVDRRVTHHQRRGSARRYARVDGASTQEEPNNG